MKLSSGHFDSNVHPILSVLKKELPDSGTVLEIASGYGQHAGFFADQFPTLSWQPSEINPEYLPSISAWASDTLHGNMQTPLMIDARTDWSVEQADAILSINLLHVSGADACTGVLKNAGRILPSGGQLLFYGPFIRPDVETAPSNLMFDQRLKQRDPEWGVPVLTDVAGEAADYGISLKGLYELPSNNVMVVFVKD